MEKTMTKFEKTISYLCMAVYFSSYVMRINFTVMLVKICSEMNMEKSALSVIVTALTVAYGVGQVVSGIIGDKIAPTKMIAGGLSLAILSNVAMSFANGIPLMAAVWAVNGVAHSMLWPPMVRLMSQTLEGEAYAFANVRVSWGSSLATILLYLTCPFLLQIMSWRRILLLCAGIGALILTVWLTYGAKVFRDVDFSDATQLPKAEKKQGDWLLPKVFYLPLLLAMLGIVLQGILRDGVTNWMPSYLHEVFHLSEENSILSTVILAAFSLVCFWVFAKIQQKWIHDEIYCATAIFAGSAVIAALLFVVNGHSVIGATVLMSLLTGCMHGINLMLISLLPKRFVAYGKVSTVSGILNACTYIGAAAATYGFAVFAEAFGWGFTIGTWIVVSLLGAVVCFFGARRFPQDNV